MRIPFSEEQFFAVFGAYNQAVWPAQMPLFALAILSVFLFVKRRAVLVSVILASFWSWMAIVYHLLYFAPINPLAKYFCILFLIQGGLFVWNGVIKRRINLGQIGGRSSLPGFLLIAYSLFIYPALNMAFAHYYPENPTFGVPCPTTIFTIGILWFADTPFPRHLLVIPLCWCVIGTSAASILNVPGDYGLAVAGLFALTKIFKSQIKRVVFLP